MVYESVRSDLIINLQDYANKETIYRVIGTGNVSKEVSESGIEFRNIQSSGLLLEYTFTVNVTKPELDVILDLYKETVEGSIPFLATNLLYSEVNNHPIICKGSVALQGLLVPRYYGLSTANSLSSQCVFCIAYATLGSATQVVLKEIPFVYDIEITSDYANKVIQYIPPTSDSLYGVYQLKSGDQYFIAPNIGIPARFKFYLPWIFTSLQYSQISYADNDDDIFSSKYKVNFTLREKLLRPLLTWESSKNMLGTRTEVNIQDNPITILGNQKTIKVFNRSYST